MRNGSGFRLSCSLAGPAIRVAAARITVALSPRMTGQAFGSQVLEQAKVELRKLFDRG